MRSIDNLLNRVTMYRLVLYYLIALIGIAVVFSFAHVLAYDPYAMLFSTAFILAVCSVTNFAFSRVSDVPANVESSAISGLILALIISPIRGYGDLWFLFWASVLSMASKYIINIHGKHLFNPAALGVALTYLIINQAAVCPGGRAADDAQDPPLQARLELYGRSGGRHLPGRAVWRPGAQPGAGRPVPLLAVLLLCLCHADRAADHPADQRPAQPVRGAGGCAVRPGLPPGVVLHHPGDRPADRQRVLLPGQPQEPPGPSSETQTPDLASRIRIPVSYTHLR